MVDFEWYRSFISIYKHNSVSEAAKTRIMTQPALSQHLASLEAEVGERLFIRTTRKLIPTERGKQLFSLLAPHIELLEAKSVELKVNPSPVMKTVKIGTTQELFNEKILSYMSQSEMNTVTYFGDDHQLLDLLKEDRIDVIVTNKKVNNPSIEYVRLMEEQFVIVAPAETIVPDFDQLKDMERWLLQQRWISYDLELPIIRRYWKEFFKARPKIIPAHVIPSLDLILKAVIKGAGMSLLPTYMLEHHKANENKWRTVFEHMRVSNELLIGFKTKHEHAPAIHEFVKNISSP